jgi:hypothetical protein
MTTPPAAQRPDDGHAVLLGLLEALVVYGILLWSYVAVIAALQPDSLNEQLTSLVYARRDTAAALAFGVSAVSLATLVYLANGWPWGAPLPRRTHRQSAALRAARALLAVMCVYGLLLWGYVSANSLTHPETLHLPLTHLSDWPTEGAAASVAFLVSGMSFAVLRIVRRLDA